ncbi:DUF3784 domain-containing protein [Youngiibacter fragilis]|uniref:DUF3784 domain-containing protein n=1 Tax=Youngiibacter fragilis 232.1 TaxID=994573 RepID=V7I1U7_9CLOT|nr:DUF3784 domain-containing protein [Youngiibacter fragilis]ETA79144.1 hypothetical protein T472_0218235 [Youngiibacter fragilis 232.1]
MTGIVLGIVSFTFLIIWYLVDRKKMYWLIAGVNTASEEQKANMDLESIGKAVGKMSLSLALINLISALTWKTGESSFFIAMAANILVPIITIVKIRKYDTNRKTKGETILAASFTLVIVIGIGILFLTTIKESSVAIEGDSVKVSGIFGRSIPLGDIEDIRIVETLPVVTMRTNGAAIGSVLKGRFKLVGANRAYLYLYKSGGPYILIETLDYPVYLNFRDDKTLYNTMVALSSADPVK